MIKKTRYSVTVENIDYCHFVTVVYVERLSVKTAVTSNRIIWTGYPVATRSIIIHVIIIITSLFKEYEQLISKER